VRQEHRRYFRDFLSELRFNFGGGYGVADLVVIEYGRSVGGRRGKTLNLFEIKTEGENIMKVAFDACRQIELYRLGLAYPEVFIDDEDKANMVRNALGFSVYLVIQEDLWNERLNYVRSYQEKLDKLLKYHRIGVITYNRTWRFEFIKEYPAFVFPISMIR